VWGPILYRRQEQKGTAAADRLTALASGPVAAIIALLAVVAVVFAQIVYDVLRDSGKPDLIVFAGVAAGSVMFGAYLINVGPAFLRDLTWLIPLGTGTGAAVNVAANFALIPEYGAKGAAIATFIAYGASAATIAVAQMSAAFAPKLSRRLAFITAIELVGGAIALAVLGPWSAIPVLVMIVVPATTFLKDLRDMSRVAIPEVAVTDS
jgi:O-antigen/teichoic acid export membrane protein